MLEAEENILQEFLSNIAQVEPVVSEFLKNKWKYSIIGINTSPLLNQPVFCQIDSNNPNIITIAKMLNLFVEKWHEEIIYQQEILDLKDQIIQEFTILCSKLTNKKLVDFILIQYNIVIERIFELSQFDKKQMAGNFCKGLMNGFEYEILEKIDSYVEYLLWIPLETCLPIKLVDFTKEVFRKEDNLENENIIQNKFTLILEYVDHFYRPIEIYAENPKNRISQFCKNIINGCCRKSVNQYTPHEMNMIIQQLHGQRKRCEINLEDVENYKEIVKTERAKIGLIKQKMNAEKYANENIPFVYEKLSLAWLNKIEILDKVFQNIPKRLMELYLDFKAQTINYEMMELLNKILRDIKFEPILVVFDLRKLSIDYKMIKIFAQATQQNKNNRTLLIEKIIYSGYVSKTIDKFAHILQSTVLLAELRLNFNYGSVTKESFLLLASSLKQQQQMQNMQLLFQYGRNEISDKEIALLANSLSHMKIIKELELWFGHGYHSISDTGLEAIATALKNLAQLKYLVLFFNNGNNSVTHKSITPLEQALNHMQSSLTAYFNFSNAKIKETKEFESQIITTAKKKQKIKFVWNK